MKRILLLPILLFALIASAQVGKTPAQHTAIVAPGLGMLKTAQFTGVTYWNDNFWTLTSDNNYVASGITLAINGHALKMRGTGTLSKNITSYAEHWIKYDSLIIDTAISATLVHKNGIGGGFPNYGYLDLTNTGTAGKVSIVLNGVTAATSSGALTFAQNDRILTTFQQMRDTLTFTAQDFTSSSTVSVTYNMTNAFATVGVNVAHAGAQYLTGQVDGGFTLLSSRVVLLNPLNPILAIAGDSKVQGYYNGSSWNNRISDILGLTYGPVANFGSSGITITQLLAQIGDVFATHPQQILLYIGCNDMRQGETPTQAMTLLQTVMGQCAAHGIVPFIISTPETGGNAAANASYDSILRVTFPTSYLDVYDTVASNTGSFIASDNIHLTQTGAAAVAAKLVTLNRIANSIYSPASVVVANYDFPTLGSANLFRNTLTINSKLTGAGLGGIIASDSSNGSGLASLLNLSSIWNTSGVATGISYKVTNIASNGSSRLLNFFVGGNSVFAIDLSGVTYSSGVTAPGGVLALKNSVNSIQVSAGAVYGTPSDVVIQGLPAANTDYTVVEGVGCGVVIGSQGGNFPVKTAINRVVVWQTLGTGQVQLPASTTARSGLNLPSGTAPTSPGDGDLWNDGTHFQLRIGGVTQQVDNQFDDILAMQAVGSAIKGQTVGMPTPFIVNASTTMNNQQALIQQVEIKTGGLITGVKFIQGILGSYTANNYNGVMLCSIAAGTLTVIASSTNDATLWQTFASNSIGNKAFTTPVTVTPGTYYVIALYCRSVEVTAPKLGSYGSTITPSGLDYTNSVKYFSTLAAQTAILTTQAMSGTTAAAGGLWFGVY